MQHPEEKRRHLARNVLAALVAAALVAGALPAAGVVPGLPGPAAAATAHKAAAKTTSTRGTLDAALEKRCKKVLGKIAKPHASKSKKLKAAWRYMTSTSRWTYHIYNFSLKDKTWAKRYAYQMLAGKRGDCYGFAACFAALAAYIGYKPVIVTCRVPGGRDHASDGYTKHGMVRIGGRWFDPEAHFAGWAKGVYKLKSYPTGIKAQKRMRFSAFDGSIKPQGISTKLKKKAKPRVVKKKGVYRGYKGKRKLKGLWCIKGRLYRFDAKGKMRVKAYRKLKAASKAGAPWETLQSLLGRPKKAASAPSCYNLDGGGDDCTYDYARVRVQTYRPPDGQTEIVLGFDTL